MNRLDTDQKKTATVLMRKGKKMNEVLFSSKSDEWATPQYLFDELDKEFHFDIDACATDENHKCDVYYTKEQDGLKMDWGGLLYFAILRTQKLVNGLKRHIMKGRKIIQWSSFSYRHERIQDGFTTTFCIGQRYDLSAEGSNSVMPSIVRHSRLW